ncbi:MAG: class I SAM-dependent methyltransferase [Pyrinomonadaceae bacterium]
MSTTKLLDLQTLSEDDVKARWEAAYLQFETPEEETQKFLSRLKKLGVDQWDRDSDVVEIFCGRGNGLNALRALGFTRLTGVDLSPELVAQYQGPARMDVADCREMPLEDQSRDLVVVQGGLHHLTAIPEDLDRVLSEVCRILRPDGRFVMVEPWLTPFLRTVHLACNLKALTALSPKLDSLAAMIHYEAPTYFRWLESKSSILEALTKRFDALYTHRGFGKINFVGRPKR